MKLTVTKMPTVSYENNNKQSFPYLPRLYLELLENKQKIKRDKINTEFVYKKNNLPIVNNGSTHTVTIDQPNSIDNESDDNKSLTSSLENFERQSEESVSSPKSNDYNDDISSIASSVSLGSLDQNETAEDIVSNRLDEITSNDIDDEISAASSSSSKYNKKRNRKGHIVSEDTNRKSKHTIAPTLKELEETTQSDNKYENVNSGENTNEKDDDLKREILFKFELLRRSYPKSTVPTYSMHTDYNTMVTSYNECLRMLSLDSSVENYKQYLTYGFMGCEFILGKFCKLDMEGFTQQQLLSMSSYDKLLIELGEKSYVPEQSKWPVEIRLLILIVVNAAFFLVSKMIMKKAGDGISKMMNNIKIPPKTENKMKGPVDIDDLSI